MKLTHIQLRVPVKHPATGGAVLSGADVYSAPDYEMVTVENRWVRVTHVQSRKSRLINLDLVLGADEAGPEPTPAQIAPQGQQQQGKRR